MGFWSTHLTASHGTKARNVNIICAHIRCNAVTRMLLFPEKEMKWRAFRLIQLCNTNQRNTRFYKLIFNFWCLLHVSNLVGSSIGRQFYMQYGMIEWHRCEHSGGKEGVLETFYKMTVFNSTRSLKTELNLNYFKHFVPRSKFCLDYKKKKLLALYRGVTSLFSVPGGMDRT